MRYPTARLLLYNQLLEGRRGCMEAMLSTAYALGIISRGSLDGIRVPPDSSECTARFVAHRILEQHVSESAARNNHVHDSQAAQRIWQEIMQDLDEYRQEHGINHTCRVGTPEEDLDCRLLSPVILDLLLQHIHSHT